MVLLALTNWKGAMVYRWNSVTLFFLFFSGYKPVSMHEGVYGLIVNILLLITVSCFTKAEDINRVKRYVKLDKRGLQELDNFIDLYGDNGHVWQ